MFMKQNYFLLFSLLLLTTTAFGQSNYWSTIQEGSFPESGVRQIIPQQYKVFKLNIVQLKSQLLNAPKEYNSTESTLTIDLPMPDGTIEQFAIVESPIMEAGLAEQFPEIKTYLGQSITNPRTTIRFDWTHKGFHAMTISDKGSVFIDPYSSTDQEHYIVYNKKDFVTDKTFNCLTDADADDIHDHNDHNELTHQIESGAQLRTYRLALACTGEYAQFHGGTVSGVLSAMVTSMNRVNFIYETEVAVRMIIIANNSSLIFLNANSDPYTNNNGSAMLGENQATIDNIIGSANYDIGHVYSTGGGGIASLRSPCNSNRKARGVTGQSSPVGDPFDVDYVAHEMGHQYGGNHTYNGTTGSCGFTNGTTNFEPGSATTIMGYAGICGAQNIQQNSDAVFHTASFDEIVAFTVNGTGNGCAVVTNTGNTKPNVSVGTGGYAIPKNTPFELTGTATDPNGDPLTYSWEQFDIGPEGHPNSPIGNAPLFRSFSPKNTPSRTFPQISDIINNTQTMGEILPDYGRSLQFRLTARDNKTGGGGVSYTGHSFNVADNSGPFLVTEPNTNATTWIEGTPGTITWDVANTNAAPVNCQFVDILLSIDGGFTYPITLATSVPNTGNAQIFVPQNTATTQARVRVQCATNIFFDISNQNFTITAPPEPTYILLPIVNEQTVCAPNEASFSIDVLSLLNYSDGVDITFEDVPTGLILTTNNNPVIPGNQLEIKATNTSSLATNTYPIKVKGTSTVGEKTITIYLTVYNETPTMVVPILPVDGEVNVALSPKLTWGGTTAAHRYDLQVSTDPNFNNLLVDETGITNTFYILSSINSYSVYYWRVKASNDCTTGVFSETFTFRTATLNCQTYTGSQTRPIIPSIALTIPSALSITNDVEIVDLNVKNLRGTHTNISDLTFTLESPAGTRVELFSRICSTQDNFDINLDDAAANANYPCPPTNGGTYQPQEALGSFSGEMSAGTWRMLIRDHEVGNGGQFLNYDLEICEAATNVNKDPIIVKNEILEASKGSMQVIPSDLLLATDADNPAADLVFTIVNETTEGELLLNGTTLTIGSTFTQVDIDNGNLSYKHNNNEATTDKFRFHVEDGVGGFAGTPEFTIQINPDSNPFDLEDNKAWIYPNPTSALLNISLRLAADQEVTFRIYDAIGQQIIESKEQAQTGTNPFTLETAVLANGVYLLVIEGTSFSLTEKLVIAK